jgi:hypothetical protein
MGIGPHTVAMTSIPGFLIHNAMRRSLLGADAQDPVVPDGRSMPDRPLRIGRLDDGLATLVDARSRRRVGTFADSESAPAHERRAA